MPGPIYIVMGVSGVGKTTIGQLISDRMQLPFFDADDFHPANNVRKMASGQALQDEDRQPWLEQLAIHLHQWERETGAVLACSALKEKYRITLASKVSIVHWVVLQGRYDLILERMQSRKGHFMKGDLLRSQFETLELPNYGWQIDISASPEQILENINRHMKKSSFGIIGLGVMGKSLAMNIAEKGFSLSVYNRATGGEEHIVPHFMKSAGMSHIQGFTALPSFIESLQTPRKILMMVKAGPVVDFLIQQLLPLLSPGDILIDGGNSHFEDTERRMEDLAQHQIEFLGVGVSGGEKGARFGPSIMPGGSKEDMLPAFWTLLLRKIITVRHVAHLSVLEERGILLK
ncbi:MAG: gluconokinase, GntK/IdnK-type [Bacteroidota bacterium]